MKNILLLFRRKGSYILTTQQKANLAKDLRDLQGWHEEIVIHTKTEYQSSHRFANDLKRYPNAEILVVDDVQDNDKKFVDSNLYSILTKEQRLELAEDILSLPDNFTPKVLDTLFESENDI